VEKNGTFEQRLMQNMYRVARCRQAMFQDLLADYGVTLQQFHLLLHIRSGKRAKVTDLSGEMLVSMPTTSRMIGTLCDLGLASRKKESKDRRSTYLELTSRGEKVVGQIHKKQLEMLSRILEKVPAGDMEAFLKTMESIADAWMALLREEETKTGGASGGPA
jgi:DNA-binding MarR family transcriptional regulator